ncbi:hypothetical protein DFP83_1351, partial [Idiomarina fontislapidosi]
QVFEVIEREKIDFTCGIKSLLKVSGREADINAPVTRRFGAV